MREKFSDASELNKVTQSKDQIKGLVFPFKPDHGREGEREGRQRGEGEIREVC